MTTDIITNDTLHLLYLGVFQRYLARLLYRLFRADVWSVGQTTEGARMSLSVLRLREELFAWYREQERQHPDKILNNVANLTNGMFVGLACELKGVETGAPFEFAVGLAERHRGAIEHGMELWRAGQALTSMLDLMRSEPWVMSADAQHKLIQLALRHLHVCHHAELPSIPTCHQLVHMCQEAVFCVISPASTTRLWTKLGTDAWRGWLLVPT